MKFSSIVQPQHCPGSPGDIDKIPKRRKVISKHNLKKHLDGRPGGILRDRTPTLQHHSLGFDRTQLMAGAPQTSSHPGTPNHNSANRLFEKTIPFVT
jgi:hypothetical protein